MIKTVHLITSLRRGGKERQLATIVHHIDTTKLPSQIIYFNESFPNYISEYSLDNHCIRICSKKFFKRLCELHRLLKKIKPDIVYSWGNLESIFVLILRPFHKFNFINGSVRHGIRSKRFSHYLRTFILHLSKNVVSNSQAGLRANNLRRGEVLYNGINNNFLMAVNEDILDLKRKLLGYDEKRTVFISVSNMVPYKDYFSILAALHKIRNESFNFLYLILGDGPLKTDIEGKIYRYGLGDNVKMVGNVTNVNEYLKISDVFIHSSKGEGCSNAILEAMASGLPVIASNTGGTSEIVNSKVGCLYKYQDVDKLYELIKNYFTNPDFFREMGKFSKKTILENYTVEKMLIRYETILNSKIKYE